MLKAARPGIKQKSGVFTTSVSVTGGVLTLLPGLDKIYWTKTGNVVFCQGRIEFDTVDNPEGAVSLTMPFPTAVFYDSNILLAAGMTAPVNALYVLTGSQIGLKGYVNNSEEELTGYLQPGSQVSLSFSMTIVE
jgi:hypothetical protein